MRFNILFILPLPLLVFSHPVIVEHESVDIIPDRPTINHVDASPAVLPQCITINTPNVRRSLSQIETSMTKTPHTTKPHRPSNPNPSPKRGFFARALAIFQFSTLHTTSLHSPPSEFPKLTTPQSALITRTLSHHSHRDSITISISSLLNNTTVCQSANAAKFEVVNNAKNANIAMGDSSNHTADFHSFGDKNMLNSTGSNTGGWNTKNRGSNLTIGRERRDEKERRGMRGKRELTGWKNWFENIWQGGDYGRWEMPWSAPAAGSSKESKADGSKWSVEQTKSSAPATETGFVGFEGGDEPTSTKGPASSKETESQRPFGWGDHKTYTRTVTMEPSKTPESKGGNGTWTNGAVQTKGPRPFRPGGNGTHPHGPASAGHFSPHPKLGGNHTANRGLVAGTLHKTGGDEQKRDIVNLNIVGGSSNSTLTRSGNDNTVEVYVAGNGDNVVNITVVWEGVGSEMMESGNGNVVRVHVGDSKGVDMGNSTLMVVGGEEI
ncbi:uncharacterized protein PAC_19627 [Phialocephala subalpina]|uniref:Uncharacterized protein n=1 Tax=Phialocephala subalpina TaxID=576137 RepID=A0A1L7XXI8_9HELO|nr:uncharacterized protein PAC_19627 [Phialocephala subalpina]